MIKTEELSEATLLLNEVESVGIKEIRESVTSNISFNEITRVDAKFCRLSVSLDLQSVGATCIGFVRDALNKQSSFDVEQIGHTSQSTLISLNRNLSENYIDNQELQDNVKKNIDYLIEKALNTEYSSLKKIVHFHEFSKSEPFSNVKTDVAKKSFFDRIGLLIAKASDNIGLSS